MATVPRQESLAKMFALASLLSSNAVLGVAPQKNVIFILTDDQDVMLGSMDPAGPMPKTRKLLVEQGAWFDNAFASTPICCPSRAEIQTGRYMHSIKVYDNGCGGVDFQKGPEKQNIAHYMRGAGYTNFYAGKYLNNYGAPKVGGVEHIPEGWDQWYGLVGNSKYYNYTVSNNGAAEAHGDKYADDYFTDYLANKSLAFLRGHFGGGANPDQGGPVFMMVATPACHGPNDPAPQYEETYAGRTSPRLPSWNKAPQPDKHYMMRQIVPMDETHINVSDVFFQRRWSVLRSVDDMVERLALELQSLGQFDSTTWIYTSDHGYHLGEFGMLYDKRMLYETDIRVPLFVRGPGIAANKTVREPVNHVDIAPTILDIAGIERPGQMEGRSWLELVRGGAAVSWRRDFLVEYNGPSVTGAEGIDFDLVDFDEGDRSSTITPDKASCSADASDELSIQGKCSCTFGALSGNIHDVSPCDGKNNTYKCLRTLASPSLTPVADEALSNSIYCEFDDPEKFVELYDLGQDPYNLRNLANSTDKNTLDRLHKRLAAFMECSGENCFDPQGYKDITAL